MRETTQQREEFILAPSRWLTRLCVIQTLSATVALYFLDLPFLLSVLVFSLFILGTFLFLKTHNQAAHLLIDSSGQLFRWENHDWQAIILSRVSIFGRFCLILTWRLPEDKIWQNWKTRSYFIFPDSLPREDYRKLRFYCQRLKR